MSDTIQYSLEGVDELLAKLESLSYDLRRKGGRAALRKAAQVVAKAVQQNVSKIDDPNTPQNISKNVTLRWSSRRNKTSGDLGFRVGILGGAKGHAAAVGEFKGAGKQNPGGDTWYWRMQEFGTENHKARPFMRPALENNIDAATNMFVTEYGKSIERALRRKRITETITKLNAYHASQTTG